jgi:hypothetical protein
MGGEVAAQNKKTVAGFPHRGEVSKKDLRTTLGVLGGGGFKVYTGRRIGRDGLLFA